MRIEVTLEEMELPEDDVLEKLNLVSTARRVANLASPLRPLSAMFFHSHRLTFFMCYSGCSQAMQDSGFGERQAINKAKEIKRRRRDAKLAGKG